MPMVLAFQFTPLREGRRGAVLFPAHSHPISIHAPPRGATLSIRFFHVSARISIHAPPRGATETARRASASSSISIHAPPRGATGRWAAGCCGRYFNSRPSARGDWKAHSLKEGDLFQFTPLREGRRGWLETEKNLSHISIHAPPRGATTWRSIYADVIPFQFTPLREGRQGGCTRNHFFKIFQFTPLREGRPIWVLMDLQQANFNSRPSARGDDALQQAEAAGVISIHAPPRGATLTDVQRHVIEAISIHAPPRGATERSSILGKHSAFQFTPLREGRRYTACVGATGISFQFTPLREGRRATVSTDRDDLVFQFTPLREGRPQPRGRTAHTRSRFQFTPLREGRPTSTIS